MCTGKGTLVRVAAVLILLSSVGVVTADSTLHLSKVGPVRASIGSQITYNLNISNWGPSPAANVILTDTLPANVEFVSASTGSIYDPVSRTVVWNYGSIPVPGLVTNTLTVQISASVPDGTIIENTAEATTTTSDINLSDNIATAVTAVGVMPANLQISKTGPLSAYSGSQIIYALNIGNSGDAALTNVTIIDTLPANVVFVAASDGGTYDPVTGNVTWPIGSVSAYPSGHVSRNVTVQIPASVSGGTVIKNTAYVNTTDTESSYNDNNASASTYVMVNPKPNLMILKSGPLSIVQGNTMTYTLSVNNLGGAIAKNVTIMDKLPPNVVFVNASDGGIYDLVTGNVTWFIGSVSSYPNVLRTVEVQVPASVPAGTVINNTAYVNTTDTESSYSDNNASASTVVMEKLKPDLQISKSGPISMNSGQRMNYVIYYNNAGSNAASSVNITDTISSDLEFVTTSDNYVYDPATRNVTWNISSVEAYPFGYGFRTVTVRIPDGVLAGTIITNTAFINTTDSESNYYNNNATVSTLVIAPILPSNVNIEPTRGSSGSIPIVYWGDPVNFSFNSSCATDVAINIHLNDGLPDITGSMIESAPDLWTYSIIFAPRGGTATVTYTIAGCEQTNITISVYVDPAGYIYDIATGERIPRANVWLEQPDGIGGWRNVSVGQSPAVMQPDVNPLITNADGQYQWDVLPGIYRVCVYADGYYSACSIEVSIPPPVTDLHVGLTRIPVPDTTAPVIAVPADVTKEATGFNTPVDLGVATAIDAVDGPVLVINNSPGTFLVGTTMVTYTASDSHLNTATASQNVTITDTTAPAITINGANPAQVFVGTVYTDLGATASDLVDGSVLITPSGTVITSVVGAYQVIYTAIDAAGNSAKATRTVNVVVAPVNTGYVFSGILQPINADNSSVFKLGSTVSVKFNLTDANGNNITNAIAKINITKIGTGLIGSETEAVSTSAATTGNLFRYDAVKNLYIYNLATKGLTVGTYQIKIGLDDGTNRYVDIGLKK